MSSKTLRSKLAWAAAFSFLVLLTACGSGSVDISGTDCTQPGKSNVDGCAYVSLSDAPGDFLTYTVNITKLDLKKADGTSVSVLPNVTRVDFAQYQDLSEFLSLNAMPSGTYVSGEFTLDYSNADIEAQTSTGGPVKLAPVDQNGNPITTLDLTIDLDPQHPLVLVPGVPRLLNVDFNLDASNIVNAANATVTVEPFLVASVDPAFGKELRVRGPLNSVDTSSGSFTLGLRPAEALSGDYGKFPIYTSATTDYIIDQQPYVGSAGLTALQAAGPDTAVIVEGQFDFTTFHLVADTVMAGSSVPGGTMDTVQGVVTSRNGSVITMRGTTLYRAGQTAFFHDTATVTLGSGTQVRAVDQPMTLLTTASVSVGQHLLAFGTLTNTNPSSLQLDASSGFALLKYTKVDGSVLTFGGGSMSMNVAAIQGRPISLFDFTGTGSNPADYQVDLGPLGASPTVHVGDPVRVFGLVAPYGSAPPDFTAHSLVDYAQAGAVMSLAWAYPGSASAFTSLDASAGIVPNLSSSPILHNLRQGGVVTNLNTLPATPTIQGSLFGLYAVLQDGKVQVYLDFAKFIDAVQTRLSAGAKVRGCFALGGFDAGTDVFSADAVAVILH